MDARNSINSANIKDAVCRALADRYSKVILTSIMDKPKSVIELSNESNIPISTLYRRIHYLNKSGLIRISKTITTDDGKKQFGENSIHMEIIFNDDMGKSAYW